MRSLTLFSFLTILSLTHSTPAEYMHNGEDWAGLCQTGTEQSPINIIPINEACDSMMAVELNIKPGPQNFVLEDKGHTLQAGGQFTTLLARNVDEIQAGYKALQFHFHAPSEHHVRGVSYDLEMHLVHQISEEYSAETSSDLIGRDKAVVGFLFEVDDSAPRNAFIDSLHFETPGIPLTVDIQALLGSQVPSPLNYYTYKGSLTTEPCSESVNWYVLERPFKIRSDQLEKFTRRYAGNPAFAAGNGDNRVVQPVGHRVVRRGGVNCVESLNYLYVFIGTYIAFNIVVFLIIKFTWHKRAGGKGEKQQVKYEVKDSKHASMQKIEMAKPEAWNQNDV